MIRLYRAGDAEGAQRIHEELIPVFDLDRVAVNPIPIKTALAMLGHEVGGFRLPLVDATDAEREPIRDCARARRRYAAPRAGVSRPGRLSRPTRESRLAREHRAPRA